MVSWFAGLHLNQGLLNWASLLKYLLTCKSGSRLGENFLLKKNNPKLILFFFPSFAVEVVELLLRSVDKPSVYIRSLAASALWALLTNNQKVRKKSFYFDLLS